MSDDLARRAIVALERKMAAEIERLNASVDKAHLVVNGAFELIKRQSPAGVSARCAKSASEWKKQTGAKIRRRNAW